jgi:hypothetical protein
MLAFKTICPFDDRVAVIVRRSYAGARLSRKEERTCRGKGKSERSSGLGFKRSGHFYSFPIQTGRPAARARLA